MNKVMLASLTAVLAGAMTMPAFADDNDRRGRGERSEQGPANKGPHREERQAERAERDEDRAARAENRERVRDRLPENREPARQAPRGVVRAPVAQAPRVAPFPQSQARDAWQAQMRDRDRDGNRDRDGRRSHPGAPDDSAHPEATAIRCKRGPQGMERCIQRPAEDRARIGRHDGRGGAGPTAE